MGQRHVLLHVQRLHEPGRLAILGHHGNAPRDAFADVEACDLMSFEAHAAARVGVHAEDRLHDLRPAGAHEAVESENFPGTDLEADAVKTGSPLSRRQPQVIHRENRRSRRGLLLRRRRRHVTPGHPLNDPRDVDVGPRRVADHLLHRAAP